MEAIENAAFISVGRACGFASLAILTVMLGLSFDPPLAMRIGGVLGMIVVGALMVYGWRAPLRPYRRTETWIMLRDEFRPHPLIAQQMIGRALRETSYRFARQGTMFSCVLLVFSIGLKFV